MTNNLEQISKLVTTFIIAQTIGCQSENIMLPPTKNLEQLIVNTSQNLRTSRKASEEEAIKEMRHLIEDSILEESWVYIPKTSEWIEVGFGEHLVISAKQLDKDTYIPLFKSGMMIDQYTIQKLAVTNPQFVVYHIHPDIERVLEKITPEINKIVNKKNENDKKDWKIELGPSSASCWTMPSFVDIEHAIRLSRVLYAIQPNGDFKFKICSSRGITTFYLTREGLDFFNNKNYLEIADIARSYRRKIEGSGNPDSARLASILSDKYFVVEFKAHKN